MKGYQWSTYVIEKSAASNMKAIEAWKFQVNEWSKEQKLINAVP